MSTTVGPRIRVAGIEGFAQAAKPVAAGKPVIYLKDDGNWYAVNGANTETALTGASASGDASSINGIPVEGGVVQDGDLLIGSTADQQWYKNTLGCSGGIVATPGSGTLYLSTAGGGDVSGTLDALTVAKIQGYAVSASAPAVDKFLRYDGTSWVPWSPYRRQISEIVAKVVARGTSAVALGAGNYTTGATFCLEQAGKIKGLKFYWPGGASKTVKCSLWKGSSLQESVNVVCGTANVYTATWASGSSGGAYPVTGNDIGTRWTVGVWSNDGTVYVPDIIYSWWPSTEEKPPQNSGYGVFDGYGMRMTNFYGSAAGDARPSLYSGGYYSAVDPIYTLD